MSERYPSIGELDDLADQQDTADSSDTNESTDTTDAVTDATGAAAAVETAEPDASVGTLEPVDDDTETAQTSEAEPDTTTDRNPTISELDRVAEEAESQDTTEQEPESPSPDPVDTATGAGAAVPNLPDMDDGQADTDTEPENPAPQRGPTDVGLQDPEGEEPDPVLEQTDATADLSQATERRSGFDDQQQQSQPSDTLIQEAARKTEFSEQEIRDIVSDDTTSVDDITNTAFVDQSDIGNRSGPVDQTTQAPAPGQNEPLFEADSGIAESLTSGGLLDDGEKELDQPDIENPLEQGDADLSDDEIKRRVAEANPGLSPRDVSVERTEDGGVRYETDIDSQDARELVAAQNEGVSPDQVQFDQQGNPIATQSGFDPLSGEFVPNESDLRGLSEQYQQGLNFVSDQVGKGVRITQENVTGTDIDGETQLERFAEGTTTGIGSIGDVPGLLLTGEQVAEFTGGTLANLPNNPGKTAETAAVVGGSAGAQIAGQFIQQGRKNPAGTVGTVSGSIAGGYGVGGLGKAAFVRTRGRLATRGMDFEGEVDLEDIEREDVRSGESRLTRFSEDAVPEGKRSMDPDKFPEETARNDPAQEMRNLADANDNPQIRQALNADPTERTFFSARSGTKGERFEPRSGRPYDPDAAFFAGSVSRNFLDVDSSPSGSTGGVPRRPRPLAAAKSLYSAARKENTPTIVATAGKVDEIPEGVRSRGEITDFLQENRNTGRFFTRKPDNQSGEAEVVVSARGADKTDPDPGAGRVESGETTEFVKVGKPLQTELRGETIPIQSFRQNTGDVTPLTQQGTGAAGALRRFIDDERAQLGGKGDNARTSTDADTNTLTDADGPDSTRTTSDTDSGTPYRPGGQRGTPTVPISPDSSSPQDSSPQQSRDTDLSTPVDPTDPTRPTPSDNDGPSSPTGPRDDGPTTPTDTDDDGDGPPTTPTDDSDDPSDPTPPNDQDDPVPPTPTITDTGTPSNPSSPTSPGSIVQNTPQTGRGRLPDSDSDEDEDEFIPVLGRAQNPVGADFINPLTGDVLETDLNVGDVDLED